MRNVVRRVAWLAGAVLLLALSAPQAALADWRRAETAHFIVYSNGSERNLRDYSARLERFDALLRHVTSGPTHVEGLRKLPVYLVENGRELRVVQPDLPEGVDGFYRASSADIRAILIRGRRDDLLLHEYTHHYMSQTSPGSYPGWFREGYAEYFATATVDARGRSTVGLPDPGRLRTLQEQRWLPLDALLTASPMALEGRGQRGAFYSQAWLLTHYLMSSPERQQRLAAYLLDLRGGADPVEAFLTRMDTTPESFARELRAYMDRGLRYAELTMPALDPAVAVTAMPDSADDVMLIGLYIRERRPGSENPAVLAEARAAVARHPGDALALTVLANAEMTLGDPAAAEPILQQVLALEPANVEALLMAARLRIAAAEQAQDQEQMFAVYREAQALLRHGFAADPTDYRILAELAEIRRNGSDYPTENDLATWRLAVEHAPQVLNLRGQAAEGMIAAGRYDEAEAYLLPIANDPHGGRNTDRARDRLAVIQARRSAGGETANSPATP
ncbi:tetratricopeptide repeat protein [Brevundimonas sp. GCM10030266]|uniref:tetratricopeptide repeat protein n=1 Tax=Brevundimonas sp. GCM10030266 TaxID=3273386 RepID=UPI003608EB3E